MSGTPRYRELDRRSSHTGVYENRIYTPTVVYERTVKNGEWKSCTDTVGNWGGDNALEIIAQNTVYPWISGEVSSMTRKRWFDQYPVLNKPGPVASSAYFPDPDSQALQSIASTVAARTNPSVANVSIPTIIGEGVEVLALVDTAVHWTRLVRKPFKKRRFVKKRAKWTLADLPYLVWAKGAAILRLIAEGHITWSFGVRPMIADLAALLDFHDAVQNRFLMLRRLQQQGAIRRRFLLGVDEIPKFAYGNETYLESSPAIVKVQPYLKLTRSRWATARWHIDTNASLPETFSEQVWLARRLTVGITKFEMLKALWELTPWSWLADWFSNVGAFLDANNNTLPVHLDGLCLMQRTTSEMTYKLVRLDWFVTAHNVEAVSQREIRKTRTVVPTLFAQLPTLPSWPALTGHQLSILGSLAALRLGSIRAFTRLLS